VAKASRFRYSYRSNASKLHKAVGEVLRTDPLLKCYKAYQEYPVNRINPDYPNGSHKFDWCIPDLKCVIEAHGQQHYAQNSFFHKTEADFIEQQRRDREKKAAAEEAGWTYVEVRYDEELDPSILVDLAIKNSAPIKKKEKSPGMSDDQKAWARLKRKEASKSKKEYIKKLKHSKSSD